MLSLRQHYQATAAISGANRPTNPGDWVFGSWFTTASGQRVSADSIYSQIAQQSGQSVQPGHKLADGSQSTLDHFLAAHHYIQWWSYQPASRFWSFQLIEGGWLLALSLILIAATVALARRRA